MNNREYGPGWCKECNGTGVGYDSKCICGTCYELSRMLWDQLKRCGITVRIDGFTPQEIQKLTDVGLYHFVNTPKS